MKQAVSDARIRKFLDLSTAHLTPKIGNDTPMAYDGVVADNWNEYGWWVWVPDDVDAHVKLYQEISDTEPIPSELINVWRYARERDCDFVLFDSDGPTNPELPAWEW